MNEIMLLSIGNEIGSHTGDYGCYIFIFFGMIIIMVDYFWNIAMLVIIIITIFIYVV